MKKLLSATAIVLFTSGIALAQTTSSGTSGGMETDTTMGASSWDEATRDAFFTDENMLRPEAEIRSGWEALDTAQQDQIRTDCQAMTADAGGTDTMTGSGTSTDTTAGATTGSSTTGDTTAGATTGSGTSTDTTAGATTDSSTTGDTTAGTTTGTGTSSETTASTTTDSSADMPDMASLQQLCTHVESF